MSVGNAGSAGYAGGMGAQAYPAPSPLPAGNGSGTGSRVATTTATNTAYTPRSADAALYSTVTGSPAANTSGVSMLPPPVQAAAGSLMSAPSSYYPPQMLVNESNGQLAMTGAASAQAPHTASRVFFATLAVYGAFLSAVAGLLTIPATLRSRGREAKFSFNALKGSDNEKYRLEQKQSAFDEADKRIGDYKTVHPAVAKLNKTNGSANAHAGSDANVSANASTASDARVAAQANRSLKRGDSANSLKNGPQAGTFSGGGSPNSGHKFSVPANFDPIEHFIAPDAENVIEHNGWWSKLDFRPRGVADGTHHVAQEYLGYFGKGGHFNGTNINHEHGEAFFASPETLEDGPIHGVLKDAGFEHNGKFIAAADLSSREHRVLPLYSRKMPADISQRNAVLDKLGMPAHHRTKLLTSLHELKRLGSTQKHVFSANSWNDQYELTRGTRHVLSNSTALKKGGQVRQRVSEFGGAAKKAFLNPVEAGNRMGLMLMSSTLLNALLVATAAVVSLGMVRHSPAKKPDDDSQN